MQRDMVTIAFASLVMFFFLIAAVLVYLLPDRHPFDQFEVIAIEEDASFRQFAVTYRYHYAESSRDVFATWILRDAPLLGSRRGPPGKADPVLAWTNPGDIVARKWSKGRLVATAAKGTNRRSLIVDCYWIDLKRLVCFDPVAVQLFDEGT